MPEKVSQGNNYFHLFWHPFGSIFAQHQNPICDEKWNATPTQHNGHRVRSAFWLKVVRLY